MWREISEEVLNQGSQCIRIIAIRYLFVNFMMNFAIVQHASNRGLGPIFYSKINFRQNHHRELHKISFFIILRFARYARRVKLTCHASNRKIQIQIREMCCASTSLTLDFPIGTPGFPVFSCFVFQVHI